jgi:hypothetical protein
VKEQREAEMEQVQREFEKKQQAIDRQMADWNGRRLEAWRDQKIRRQQRTFEVRRRRLMKAELKANKLAVVIAKSQFRSAHGARKRKTIVEVVRVADQWVRSYMARQNIARSERRREYLGMQMMERERQKEARLDEIRKERNRQRDIRIRQMRALVTHYG